jgi:hypothetical protein
MPTIRPLAFPRSNRFRHSRDSWASKVLLLQNVKICVCKDSNAGHRTLRVD